MTTYKVRVCPVCGTENPATASDCEKCKADILGEPLETRYVDSPKPTPAIAEADPDTDKVQPAGSRIVLEALQSPDLKFDIAEGQSVGRTPDADIVLKGVPNIDYISRKMAMFTRRGQQWYVQHLGSTNYITVDGERYESDDNIAIHNGSVLGLALCQFMVRIPGEQANDNG